MKKNYILPITFSFVAIVIAVFVFNGSTSINSSSNVDLTKTSVSEAGIVSSAANYKEDIAISTDESLLENKNRAQVKNITEEIKNSIQHGTSISAESPQEQARKYLSEAGISTTQESYQDAFNYIVHVVNNERDIAYESISNEAQANTKSRIIKPN